MSKNKNNLKRLESRILSFFKSNSSKVYNYKQIASFLEIKDTKGRNNIIFVLNQLEKNKIISTKFRGKYQFNISQKKIKEVDLMILPSGKGIVKLDIEEFIVPNKKLNKALDGDRVSISVHKKKHVVEAHVEKIIKRNKKEYVGIFERQKDFGFVLCKKGKMYTDLFIPKSELKNYNDGDKVVALFKEWNDGRDTPNGTIIKSLGNPGETQTEIHSILHEYGLPYSFMKPVIKEAKSLSKEIEFEEIKKRRDFRDTLTFTIDPITAKDFDDAISFRKIDNNLNEVGIHIADVSHYVQPNSLLDKEAYERATSVYLVDRVVPMLPEVISNGLCSLRPKEEKYTFSAVFILDNNGRLKKEWYGKSVIYSDHRFSYEEVQFMIENKTNKVDSKTSLTGKEYKVSSKVYEAISTLNRQAKKLRKQRMDSGAISFDRVEVGFNLDDRNKPEKVFFKSSKDSNKLIEEFMLLANKKVAAFIGKQKPAYPFVYRIHDDPDEEKLYNLKQTISAFGYSFNPKGKNVSKEINKLLKDCNGSREQNMIDTLTLRTMSKAEYTTNNIGHYGLAFSHYTHFTSPIRRYPDVLVHRLLHSFIEKKRGQQQQALEEACKHSSQREQLATKAERDSIKYMQIIFMEDKVGLEFNGIISGVTDRGMYVEIIENKCEGMIRLVDLKEDYFNFDMQNHAIVGERTKKSYRLGDPIRIKVSKVNAIRRFLDFIPVE